MKKLILLLTLLAILIAMYVTGGRDRDVTSVPERYQLPLRKSNERPKTVVRGRTPMETATKFLQSAKLEIREHHELRPEVTRTPLGPRVTYEIYQDGIPILGMYIDLRLNRNMELVDSEVEYHPLPKADTNARLSADEVAQAAQSRYQIVLAEAYSRFVGKVLVARSRGEAPELAYVVPTDCGHSGVCQTVLRALDGQMLARSLSRGEF